MHDHDDDEPVIEAGGELIGSIFEHHKGWGVLAFIASIALVVWHYG